MNRSLVYEKKKFEFVTTKMQIKLPYKKKKKKKKKKLIFKKKKKKKNYRKKKKKKKKKKNVFNYVETFKFRFTPFILNFKICFF